MVKVNVSHFQRAAIEIGHNGENDTLPYDLDAVFVKDMADDLSELCFDLFQKIDSLGLRKACKFLSKLTIAAERLLVPSGPHGFRITTKIHPFWNLYLNGLGLAIAEASESQRSNRAHSYRLASEGPSFFDRKKSWRAYKLATLSEPDLNQESSVVIQTDISSFYEHIYHHRLENIIKDLSPSSTLALQIDRILSQLMSGRSFGLPVGGQCSRILAEVMMMPIDRSLTDGGLVWHRYVDDYTLICSSRQDAYEALSNLSHNLADYGLSLNRSKTTLLSAKHYRDFVAAQLGDGEDASVALRELDLHFDPYSDNPAAEYQKLKQSFEKIDITFLLDLEREKSQPDAFVLAQIGRALKFQEPGVAIQLCATLLDPNNLDSFRASWSKIMRGVYAVRTNDEFATIFDEIDSLLDKIPDCAPHLLVPEANMLHYLRAIRFRRTDARGPFLLRAYRDTLSASVRRACIDCWRIWHDRASFNRLRNQWQTMGANEQRMLWLAAGAFGDEGEHARKQLHGALSVNWRLGIEESTQEGGSKITDFATIFLDWVKYDK
ncbi:RNA-directed DNA polymerase [Segnochrobactrum spirostomi]|uniref:Reverse transcriptase n=1 Tax=Segnochrobactrum spirostomi TaxID=2608987 RepID=A0A6A7Y427_9HYPH|nr:reverse transcriptase domain-containing protein [Segnochrobactrum spirostomi]MQT13475.1 reverse transcriptase [Segnochrobactrum spirostomi]